MCRTPQWALAPRRSKTHTDRGGRNRVRIYSWQQPVSGESAPPHDASSSSNALASFRSSVSNPSVNQPKIGARRSRASSRLSWPCHSRAVLIAARNNPYRLRYNTSTD
jgi:hypothetical protein